MRFLHKPAKNLSWKQIRERLLANKKRTLAVLCCLLALLLLALSELPVRRKTAQTEAPSDAQYAQTLEARLTALIEQIDGAGKTQVLVTLRTGTQTVWARNDKSDSDQGESQSRVQTEQNYVLVRNGSGENGLVLNTRTPQVLGVAVVCAGAGDPLVRQNITQTVTSVLGIGASHVSVVKMETERNR